MSALPQKEHALGARSVMGHHEPVELAARVWDRLLRLVVSRRLGICRRVRRI